MTNPLFESVLVANRGEIAVRVMRTLSALGIRSIAVYSDADAYAPHVRLADHAYRLGPAPASESYLSIERVIEAVRHTGASAVHPGYGFLAENAEFAEAVAAAGAVFIGPPAAAIMAMGDKIRAKQTVSASGVPVVPGRTEPGMDDAALVAAAEEVGYPVLVKPSAGGGGKGMRRVDDPALLAEALVSARREAASSFGDDTLFVERFVTSPRHIEIQVLADTHGNVIHLGERECSLQRRHQKIVEEAPSPLLTPEQRASMGAAAADAARSVGYVGAGTVEFIVSADRPDEFFFMEMNTRLQVEHPVTEQVYGVDLVEQQIRVAAGERLDPTLAERVLEPCGHAIEVRIYAEDPANGFLPTGGRILAFAEPNGPGIRVDSGVSSGSVVGSDYDPMLAKVIASGRERAEALARMDRALASTTLLGLTTNIAFLRALLADDEVAAGRLDTSLVDRFVAVSPSGDVPDEVFIAGATLPLLGGAGTSPWDDRTGWRLGGHATIPDRIEVPGGAGSEVRLRWEGGSWRAGLPGRADRTVEVLEFESGADGTQRMALRIDGVRRMLHVATDGATRWIGLEGGAWPVIEPHADGTAADGGGTGAITAPMPGKVIVLAVAVGDSVTAGQVVAVVEAMKMEHALTAPADGVVTEVHRAVGDQVTLHEIIAVVEPAESQ